MVTVKQCSRLADNNNDVGKGSVPSEGRLEGQIHKPVSRHAPAYPLTRSRYRLVGPGG